MLEPDFRNRYEENPAYSSVEFPSSSDREGRRGPTWVPAFLAEQQRAR